MGVNTGVIVAGSVAVTVAVAVFVGVGVLTGNPHKVGDWHASTRITARRSNVNRFKVGFIFLILKEKRGQSGRIW